MKGMYTEGKHIGEVVKRPAEVCTTMMRVNERICGSKLPVIGISSWYYECGKPWARHCPQGEGVHTEGKHVGGKLCRNCMTMMRECGSRMLL